MQAPQKILFPVDMSDSGTAAAPFVESLARKFQAEVTLLHVFETPSGYMTDFYGFTGLVDTQPIRDAFKQEFEQYLRADFQSVKTKRVFLEGDPAQNICAFAADNGADLIMMPTRGYGMFRSLLLGSTTAKVLHDATCPVWTGVHVEEAQARSDAFEHVMCAVDLTAKSIPAMQFASRVAKEFKAKLWLVHAVPGAETRPQKYFDADLQIYLEEEARKEIAALQDKAGVHAQLCLGAGEVPHVVCAAALHHEVDLLVTGRGHATENFGRLRTNVYSIIRQSPCPVISV